VTLPLAHAGHYVVWVLYALPVLVVIAVIVKSAISQRREDRRRGRE
jgi:heme exporter protein D